MTPAEKAGWEVGGSGRCHYPNPDFDEPQFKEGEWVVLDRDDGTVCPKFKSQETGECKYEELQFVTRHPGFNDTPDPVNHPPHYTQGGVECIDAIRAALTENEFRGYCKGNAIKYLWRERHKGGDESLHKAMWYVREALGENER